MEKILLIIFLSGFIPVSVLNCPVIAVAEPSMAAAGGRLRPLAGMAVARAAHTATLLEDGRVLIVGGFKTGGGSLRDVEVFTPGTGVFETIGSLSVARAGHTATVLPDRKVLIAGGFDGTYLDSSEIFDPKTRRFSPGPRLTMPRSEHTATRLPDGRILLAGGVGTGWTFLSDAEIYDPHTGRFFPTGKMSTPRESHTATLLRNGKVLITGGHKDRRTAMTIFASTEMYDPSSATFRPTADLTIKRHKHDAVLLTDGRVLISGGSDERDSQGAYNSVEIFDPVSGRSSKGAELRKSRYKLNGAVVRLPSGKVLVAGGSDSAEIFDPVTLKTSLVTGTFGSKRLFATATLLKDGRVLIAGGYDEMTRVGQEAWLYESNDTKME
jgi:hypothetical protein